MCGFLVTVKAITHDCFIVMLIKLVRNVVPGGLGVKTEYKQPCVWFMSGQEPFITVNYQLRH